MRNLIPEIPVVYFHSVAPAKNPYWVRNFLTFELSSFENFLKFLKKGNWQTIPLKEYYEIRKRGKKPKNKICCLTFDDGYVDNYIYLWPLLKKYGFIATIFINPESVDQRYKPFPTLEDVWEGSNTLSEIEQWGYLSWEEMRIMQKSGVIDIQSHTLTHTKYFVSDELKGFHYPGDDCLYPIGNLFPERKPYYITDPEFERLVPFGYPFFEELSSVIAKRVTISDDFNNEVIDLLKKIDLRDEHSIRAAHKIIMPVYNYWSGKIIEKIETSEDYYTRVKNEIYLSKKIIEEKLNTKVSFLCWPHGDNSEELHQMSMEAGYLATTTGSNQKMAPSYNRISIRIGIGIVMNNRFLTRLKTGYKFSAASGNTFAKTVHTLRERIG
jgi:hypothetical protein